MGWKFVVLLITSVLMALRLTDIINFTLQRGKAGDILICRTGRHFVIKKLRIAHKVTLSAE